MENSRDRHVKEIQRLEAELAKAGPVHARDLKKHINRMKKDLKIYDFYMRKHK